jgi:hypothetical protein
VKGTELDEDELTSTAESARIAPTDFIKNLIFGSLFVYANSIT